MTQVRNTAKLRLRGAAGAVLATAIAGALVPAAASAKTAATRTAKAAAGGTVYFGVSGPKTGEYAQYGEWWNQGFNLAISQINAAGRLDGQKIGVKWYDSQSNPTQSVTIAQKIIDDSSIIGELGDFSSTASMAATSIYQRAGLIQYGFTNSDPDFTHGGSVAFSPSLDNNTLMEPNADAADKLGNTAALLYMDTVWGKSTESIWAQYYKKDGGKILYTSSYDPTATDFRTVIENAEAKHPKVLELINYDADGAAIVKQANELGWTNVKVVTDQFGSDAIKLAGSAANGVYTVDTWWPTAPDPAVKKFVAAFKKAYHQIPATEFPVDAYDALEQLVAAAKLDGATRAGVLKGVKTDKKLPSVEFGPFAFNSDRRPPSNIKNYVIVVKNGAAVLGKA